MDSRKPETGSPPFLPYRQDYYFFFLPRAGRSRHWIDFISYDWQPGSIYFTQARHIHLNQGNEPLEGTLLAFTEKFLLPEDMLSRKKLPILQNPDDIHELKLSGEERDFLHNLFVQMQAGYSQQQDSTAGIMRSYLNIFLVYMSRIYTRQFNASPPSDDQWKIGRLKELLHEKYDPQLQAADYARLLDITPGQLNKLIMAYTGKTATALVQERIILEARRIIVHGDLSLKEMATSLGFDDAGFSRFFKRLTGETPTAFRASLDKMLV